MIRLAAIALAAILGPALAEAHMVSISTGELKLDGATAHYQLLMPLFEAAHIPDPARTLPANIHFRSGAAEAQIVKSACAPRPDAYVCEIDYRFPFPPDRFDAECAFSAVTVPNHIHILNATLSENGELKTDRAVFDYSNTRAEIRFHPPAPWEIFVRESGAGFFRAIGGLAPLLFLASLALAARSRAELAGLAASFAVAELAVCVLLPQSPLNLSPRFIEAAAALTIAYLAFEILLLPQSGSRWLVVAVLGLFHGANFSLFLTSSGYRLENFMSGVILAELLVLAAAYAILAKLLSTLRIPKAIPALASALLATGLVWFTWRIWG